MQFLKNSSPIPKWSYLPDRTDLAAVIYVVVVMISAIENHIIRFASSLIAGRSISVDLMNLLSDLCHLKRTNEIGSQAKMPINGNERSLSTINVVVQEF